MSTVRGGASGTEPSGEGRSGEGRIGMATSGTTVAGMASAGIDTRDMAARAVRVNRTHRVVRERAKSIQTRRRRARSLWIPMLICAALLLMSSTAIWSLLDQYEMSPTGIPDASGQMLVLLLWFLPVSAALLAMVWFRRTRTRSAEEAMS